MKEITFVRLYITEGDKLLNQIMRYLHDEVKIQGVTVFRAISGFGKSGAMHSSQILSMSFDLPLAVEFFDEPDKVEPAIAYLQKIVPEGHVVSWPGRSC